jgi:hypothetical protein
LSTGVTFVFGHGVGVGDEDEAAARSKPRCTQVFPDDSRCR